MAQAPNDKVLEDLKRAFHKSIPSGAAVFREAVDEELGEKRDDIDWIKANFSALVESIQMRAYEIYLKAEERAGGLALRTVLGMLVNDRATPEQVLNLVAEYFTALDRFFLGLTQGRRPRAGAAFESLITDLFSRLGYPFTAKAVVDGRPDFLLPSLKHYRKHPLDCIIFTVKRTLRERWRQIVTEGTKALGFYLATIDENVGGSDLRDMTAGKIFLVVPQRLKTDLPLYRAAGNVLSFEDFFAYHLDPAMTRWRAAEVI